MPDECSTSESIADMFSYMTDEELLKYADIHISMDSRELVIELAKRLRERLYA